MCRRRQTRRRKYVRPAPWSARRQRRFWHKRVYTRSHFAAAAEQDRIPAPRRAESRPLPGRIFWAAPLRWARTDRPVSAVRNRSAGGGARKWGARPPFGLGGLVCVHPPFLRPEPHKKTAPPSHFAPPRGVHSH